MARQIPPSRNPVPPAAYVAIAVFAATPLALVPGVFLSHDVIPKTAIVLTGAAVLLFLVSQWRDGLLHLLSRKPGKWFLLLAAAQAASLVLSTLLSDRPLLSFAGTVWRRFGMVEQLSCLVIACAIAALVARTPSLIATLLRAAAVCGSLGSIYAISQYFGFDPFLEHRLYTIDYLGGIVRPPATMGHAIYFAAWLVPVILLSADAFFHDPSAWWRRSHGLTAFLGLFAILLSGTRGSLIAVAGGSLMLLGVVWSTHRRALLAGAGVFALAVAALLFSPAGENFRHRLGQWRQDPGTARLGVWRDVPELIAAHPLLGSGPETFAAAFRLVESAALSREYPDFFHETPHNAFIDAACAQGIMGALILAGLFTLAFATPGSPGLRAALLGILIGSMFASLTLVTAIWLWSIAGLLAALSSRSYSPAKSHPPLQAPASVFAIALLVVALALAVQDAAYARLQRAVEAKDLPSAIKAYERATTFLFGLPGYELWSSQQLATLGRALANTPGAATAWTRATDAADLSERRGEDPFSATYQSSILAIIASNPDKAEQKARDAIILAPNWYKPHLLRSQILQALGQNDEAAREARISAGLGWKQK